MGFLQTQGTQMHKKHLHSRFPFSQILKIRAVWVNLQCILKNLQSFVGRWVDHIEVPRDTEAIPYEPE